MRRAQGPPPVAAWKAVLSSMQDFEFPVIDRASGSVSWEDGSPVRFNRFGHVLQSRGYQQGGDGGDPAFWQGFREIAEYDREIDVAETGRVLSAGDGIARIYGLGNALAGELVEFVGGVRGMVLNLEEDNAGVAIIGESHQIREGDVVRRTGRIIEADGGDFFLGHMHGLHDATEGAGLFDGVEVFALDVLNER